MTVSLAVAPLAPIEKIRAIANEKVEIKFSADEDLLDKVQKLKGLLAHKNPNMSLAELFDLLCNLGLEKWDKTISAPARENLRPPQSTNKSPSQAQVRRAIWKKAQGKCQICGSGYALEIDHIQPKSLGGGDEPENLRLLCRSCNHRAAIQALGIKKMEKYLAT